MSYAEDSDEGSQANDAASSTEDGGDSGSDFEGSNDDTGADEDEGSVEEEDVESSEEEAKPKRGRKSQSSTTAKRSASKLKQSPANGKRLKADPQSNQGEGEEEDYQGGEVTSVTKLAPAPSQRHKPRCIGQPVIDFLAKLADPRYNDREWFHAHDRVWRWVKDDWERFVATFLEVITDSVDETVPYMPVKDLVYRIHRDIRFSNDKTPYKRTLMATFSRGGRKGPFAGYHLCIRAKGESALHAGLWDPPANFLATLRNHIQEESTDFQQFVSVVSAKDFTLWFGAAEPNEAKGIKGSMWGRDELKTAPKGVEKTHPRIHFLRLKSYCVSHYFTDEEVVADDFEEKLVKSAKLARPFVESLNEMIHPSPPPPPGIAAAAAGAEAATSNGRPAQGRRR